ncbi:hypothetical protein PRIPAC_76950 [Pristionchus pacificus]|nr:hypothetical protein PRIPAC_76950 [Pristionchus pacificus]
MMSEPTQLPVDSHFTVNEDNFLISCSDGKNGSGHELFSRAYMGVKMADNNELILGQNFSKLRNLWKLCWDGRLMSEEFMMPWFIALQRLGRSIRVKWWKFSKSANKCFFSFNFLTSPSHDNPNNLESVDDGLYTRLQALNNSGSLSNTMLIIMGDHGQRMHFSQMKFAGRIEERQPLMSMLFPKGFKDRYQTEFENLLTNVNRLTSNVDIHETLLDIIDNRFGKTRPEGRGRSLFTPIPTSRTCTEAWIPKNFCLCQYRVTVEERESKNICRALKRENHTLFQPHQSVRMGMRTKANWTEKMARTIPSKAFFAQTHCEIRSSSDILITLLVRSRVDLAGLKHSIAYSPMIVKAEGKTWQLFARA